MNLAHITSTHSLALPLFLALTCGAGCSPSASTKSQGTKASLKSDSSIPPAAKPWTAAFMKPAVLIADVIEIDGPEGLRDHLATRTEPLMQERVEKVVPRGFLTEIKLLPGKSDAPIKAWLDQLELAAVVKLVVLEHPGPVDVTVSAHGQVLWADKTTNQQQRSESFTLVGKLLP
jgi:hypothetical protein